MILALLLAGLPPVQIAASIDGGPVSTKWAYAKVGQRVVLHAQTKGEVAHVKWFAIEPAVGALDNTTPSFHFEPVTYAERAVCGDAVDCAVTMPTKVMELPGVGTLAYRVEVTFKDGTVAKTPGMESMKYGGLGADVFRVAIRRDDSLIGFATELINTPYIFGSAGPDGRNQSDLLIGSDCADFIVYARRRMGKKAEYTSSYALDRQAPELKKGPARAGDIVHFPSMRHVAILFEDREPRGVVDENDLILHTCWAPPTVQRIGDTSCVAPPYRVLRFQ